MTLLAQDFKFASNTKTGPSAAANDTTDVYQRLFLKPKVSGPLWKKSPIKNVSMEILKNKATPLSVQVVVEKVHCFDALIA